MDVYWLEQSEADVPKEDNWLSAGEATCLSGMRFVKRRTDWRLGRWTAKQALAACLHIPNRPSALAEIEVRAAPSGVPEVFVANQPAALCVSLSHRAGWAACSLARTPVDLGCDLETIEPHGQAFVADYFTAEEQSRIAQVSASDQPRLVALLWSGKESTLKALHTGLRLDTRSVVIHPGGTSFHVHGWQPLEVRCANARVFHGWWRCADSFVRTVVAAPPPSPPTLLEVPHLSGAATHS
ncbi:MAG TPA: 4'-phosphopantetheinyl transferase superfamily protein [Terriglobales bacterium]|nr:4'-phosphopantetheinyl transferase superfamily protein [Terriglobales bacterium]